MVLKLIKHCILATDLALFFVNKAKMKVIIDQTEFDWNIPDHRYDPENDLFVICFIIKNYHWIIIKGILIKNCSYHS